MKLVVGLIGLLGVVDAACPNSCSGHGSCGTDDICTCYPGWQEGDCSYRQCPHTLAFSDVKDSTVTGRENHWYEECGNRGTCDRSSGICECDEGFEGEGCDRMSCPGGNNCNGHGTCETLANLDNTYTAWDASKIQVCVCDPGYEGHDCSSRKCKTGDDPLSRYDASGTLEADEVQTLRIQSTTSFDAGSQFLLKYTDWRGQSWVTRPIDVDTFNVIGIREALLSLPQRAIDDLTVSQDTSTAADKQFKVTFTSQETPGDQPELVILTAGCTAHGCQPYYKGVTGGTISTTITSTDGTAENVVCSGRGICDSEQGVCQCFSGFYGEACDKQTVVR